MATLFEKESISLFLDDVDLIDDVSSDLQSVQLFQHKQLGKILVINNEIQHVEKWNPFYHESIVHIPMMFIKNPQNVLIIGGGDLFAACEVLKYPSIKKLVLCDYDKNVIKLMQKHYAFVQKILGDDRLEIVNEDAREFILRDSVKNFDLIIDDCFNLVQEFDSCDVFSLLKSKLSSIGICSSLMYRHIFDSETIEKTQSRLINKTNTVISLVTVPEYPGILHLLTMWGNASVLNQNLSKSINQYHNNLNFKLECSLFNPKYINYYLYLPPYVERILTRKNG